MWRQWWKAGEESSHSSGPKRARKLVAEIGEIREPHFAHLPDWGANDVYRCPHGETLSPHGASTTRGHRLLYYHPTACRRCPLQAHCTSNPRRRRIARWEGEAVLDAMAVRLAANPQVIRVQCNTVEHPFGTIKHAMNQGHVLQKGLRQVRAEFSPSTLAYNLRRVINNVGVQKLVEALRRLLRAFAGTIRRTYDLKGWFYARVFTSTDRREKNFVPAGLLASTKRRAGVFIQPPTIFWRGSCPKAVFCEGGLPFPGVPECRCACLRSADQTKHMVNVDGIPQVLMVNPEGVVRCEGFPRLEGHELTEGIVEGGVIDGFEAAANADPGKL